MRTGRAPPRFRKVYSAEENVRKQRIVEEVNSYTRSRCVEVPHFKNLLLTTILFSTANTSLNLAGSRRVRIRYPIVGPDANNLPSIVTFHLPLSIFKLVTIKLSLIDRSDWWPDLSGY